MIKLEKTEVVGWEAAIRGMRNPLNSWDRSDSKFEVHELESWPHDTVTVFRGIGSNDHNLVMQLAKGGPVHAKYRRMIAVYVDITAPLYWWKEFKTYRAGRKFGDQEPDIFQIPDEYLEFDIEMNSCSTMHKIHAKEFTMDDFSHEHLVSGLPGKDAGGIAIALPGSYEALESTITVLNRLRDIYLNGFDSSEGWIQHIPPKSKDIWWQMIQLLPTSYNQKRTVMLNYEVLTNMYHSRKNHKLDEWRTFCEWIEGLPYSEIITGMSESERMIQVGENIQEGFQKGMNAAQIVLDEHPQGSVNVTLVNSETTGEKIHEVFANCANWPVACDLCNRYGYGDADEERCKNCRFHPYSKWAKKSDK